jgi:hypothetical protein
MLVSEVLLHWIDTWLACLIFVYLITYYDGSEFNGRRHWPRFCGTGYLRWLRRFFGLRLVRTGEDATLPHENQKQTIYLFYPHGQLAFHMLGAVFVQPSLLSRPVNATQQRRLRHVLTGVHPGWHNWPVIRDMTLWAGGINVRWSTLVSLLMQGYDLALAPEGEHGMEHNQELKAKIPDKQHAILERLASQPPDLLARLQLRVVFCPNERAICRVWKSEPRWVTRIRGWLSQRFFGYPLVLFFGPWPWKPLVALIGEPLDLLINESVPVHLNKSGAGVRRRETQFAMTSASKELQGDVTLKATASGSSIGRDERHLKAAHHHDELKAKVQEELKRLEAYWTNHQAELDTWSK